MGTFKDIARDILKESGKPLHSDEITKIAVSRGWLKTAGKTPAATMNSQLVVDINSKKEASIFRKTGPSTFALRDGLTVQAENEELKEEKKKYAVSPSVSTK